MGGLVPLSDASRRPARIPIVTVFIILANALVFVLELMNGEAFVTQWSAIPAQVTSGHHWITILTAMTLAPPSQSSCFLKTGRTSAKAQPLAPFSAHPS